MTTTTIQPMLVPSRGPRVWHGLGRYGALLMLVALVLVMCLLEPNTFATWDNLVNVLNQSALSAVIAIGLTFTLVTGEFDLSIGNTASLGGVVACTLMVDGRPTRSCLTFAATCSGAEIRTVESFGDDPVMIALRAAFNRFHALQCGYCTPGMLATAYDVVTRLPDADEARIREELSGNLCRCTGYAGIVAAIGHILAEGVPEPGLRPMERAAVSPRETPSGPRRPRDTAGMAQASGDLPALPERLDNPVTLQRVVDVPVPVDRLWTTIRDIETVARCLPGASIEEATPDSARLNSSDRSQAESAWTAALSDIDAATQQLRKALR